MKLRRCLGGCNKRFVSSSSAERICPACRKRNRAKGSTPYMNIYSVTPEMERHMRCVEELEHLGVSPRKKQALQVSSFLDNESNIDFEDDFIYDEIKEEEVLTDKEEVMPDEDMADLLRIASEDMLDKLESKPVVAPKVRIIKSKSEVRRLKICKVVKKYASGNVFEFEL